MNDLLKATFNENQHSWILSDNKGTKLTINVSTAYRWTFDPVFNDVEIYDRTDAKNKIGFIIWMSTSGYFYARYLPNKEDMVEGTFDTWREAITWLNNCLNNALDALLTKK